MDEEQEDFDMKAPDKIYTDNRGVYSTLPVFSQTDANIEYIRKDALLEWLESILKCKPDNAGLCTEAAAIAVQQVIDKLNNF